MKTDDNQIEETRDVNVSAILGGVLSLFSPLALISSHLLFIPVIALVVILVSFLRLFLHRAPMIGTRFAFLGLYMTLFFGACSWSSASVYRSLEVDSARYFASQWFELMTSGRQLEALQLENPVTQRARGLGIQKRYTTDHDYMESYKNFMSNDAVKYILREFQGGEVRFVRLENVSFSRRLTSYFVVFELAKGEGVMCKTREFKIQIAAAKEVSEKGNRYEWTTRLIEVI